MRKVIYSMTVSLDGYVTDSDGEIDWTVPDEELHRFHNQEMRTIGVQLMGRRLYETMLVWDTTDESEWSSEAMLEFARIWKGVPKVVFSKTLDEVVGDSRLVRDNVVEEVIALKEQDGDDIAVGGAGLAATCIAHGLVDEYRLFVRPVVLGGGTPYFPNLDHRIQLDLVESRTFGDRVVYLRYRRG